MQQPAFDPGLTTQYGARLRRAVNQDGSFNVRRTGATWRAFHLWQSIVNMSWAGFGALAVGSYLTANTVFALIYFLLPLGEIDGVNSPHAPMKFLFGFFFSAHTLTTVGYGNFAPRGILANSVASVEALTGLLGFSVLTGLLVARASKPSARIRFSRNALIAPYQNASALMFRAANERPYNLMEVEARVMLMTVDSSSATPQRKFDLLALERPSILFFALSWTVVHPIDESSPLFGRTAEDLERLQAEVLVMIKGFDETFGQTVNARYSWRYDELIWGAKFTPTFFVDPGDGGLVLELDRLGDFERVPASTA
ncbi:MAG TPA: ion channel [Bryobacteraceae bacterium]|jgi:inward rectifier potassium channel|nr:ion channel [Bryobacteraceae bacterium]